MAFRALLFDFGGTLDAPRHWLDRFVLHYRNLGIELSRDQLDPAYRYATQAGYQSSESMRSRGLRDTVCFLVAHQVEYLERNGPEAVRERIAGLGDGGHGRFAERTAAEFAEESMRGMAHSRKVLAELKPRLRLGVVSNFYGNLDRVLGEARMLELLDAVVDSSRVGIFKPDPRIFGHALAELKMTADPGSVAMVGDSPDKDCIPARKLGLATIWLCGPDRHHAGPVHDFADRKIHTLDELLKLE
ncbi:MAG: HAD family hydrolase [Candidatus Binataceae bacterium]